MGKKNIAAFSLTLISLILLFPGLTYPMLTLKVSYDFPILGNTVLYDQKQSILQTVDTLWQMNNRFVAFLIFFFSVVIPFTKGVIIMAVLIVKNFAWKEKLYRFVYVIGKWSMADVFVVGVFIAFLSTKSNHFMDAGLVDGFYYFVGYCLLSLAGIQLTTLEKRK